VKTYAGFVQAELSLGDYLSPGDRVDTDLVTYVRGVLPPACDDGHILQLGEPASHVGLRPVYLTFVRFYPVHGPAVWSFVGKAWQGEATRAPAHVGGGEDRQVAVWLVREEYETLIAACERAAAHDDELRELARLQRFELRENEAFSRASAARGLIAKLSHYHARAKPRQS
jgi:hypothetical protein